MPKLNVNSRNNAISTVGILDLIDSKVDQPILRSSDVTFNALNVDTNVTIGENLTVTGNLVVLGDSSVLSSDITEIKDNILLLNSEETSTGVLLNLSGTEVNRGTLVNFQAVFDESDDLYKIGEVGDLQVVATREDLPLNKGILVYNETLRRLDSVTTVELPILFSGGQESSDSATGTVKVSGGIGVTGNIYTDKGIYFRGSPSTYTTSIISNNTNDILINTAPGDSIIVSGSTLFRLGDVSFVNTGDDLIVTAPIGSFFYNTAPSGQLNISEQTFLRWGLLNNDITFNGTDLVLRSTGDFEIEATMNITDTTPSTSSTVGALVLAGGLSISQTQDAANSDNGGSITTAGGLAVKKKAYFGDKILVGDTATSETQITGEGITFRSLSKSLTTSSTANASFNTFEGGSIVTAAVIPEAATVNILGAPSVSGGGTLTKSYSLLVNQGTTLFKGFLESSLTTPSTSSTSGAVLFTGGLSISQEQDAVNSDNGGAVTVAGGLAVKKKAYFGDKILVGDTATSETQITNQGITFRSLSKSLTTSSTANASFNTFEGGSVVTAAVIPEAATVNILGAPSISGGGTLTNSYSLLVNQGTALFKGAVNLNNNLSILGNTTISNVTDATVLAGQSSLTTLGGVSISKNLLVGNAVKTHNGTTVGGTIHYSLGSRFAFGLKGIGSNLVLNNYNDSEVLVGSIFNVDRTTSVLTFENITGSTSPTAGSVIFNGGVSISSSLDSTNADNGGTFTTAGGAAIKRRLFVGGNAQFDSAMTTLGTSNLNKTAISTNNGSLDISGTSGVLATVGASSNLTVTTGSLTLASTSGTLIMSGDSGATLSSNATSSFSGNTVSISSTVANTSITSAGQISVVSNGAQSFDTTNLIDGIKINTANSGGKTTIGHPVSQTNIQGNLSVSGNFHVLGTTTNVDSTLITIADNAVVVNALPGGLSDGGLLMRRYQTSNNTGLGAVVDNTPKETSTFQTGSSSPGTLVLNAGSSGLTNYYKGWWIKITSGAATGTVRRIKEYDEITQTAQIYTTNDNNDYNDGLDLSTAPSSGDTYELFDSPYSGIYFSEALQEVSVAGVAFDIGTGQFPTPTSYLPIHAKSLIIEDAFTTNGSVTSYGNITVISDGLQNLRSTNTSAGVVFNVDTIFNITTIGSPVNGLGTSSRLAFEHRDLLDSVTLYSGIRSQIVNNIPGSLESSLIFSVQTDAAGFVDTFTLNGISGSTLTSKLFVTDTTASTSSSSGCLVLSGGLSVSEIQDAVSSTNGGGITVAGGLAVAKKMFAGAEINSELVKNITGNVVSGTEGSVNLKGDLATEGKIVFSSVAGAVPSFTARSSGTKLVLKPNISGSTVDSALGTFGDSIWYSTETSHSFYLGTVEQAVFDTQGLNLPVTGTGVTLGNSSIKGNGSDQLVATSESFVFKNGSNIKTIVNASGQIKTNITSSNVNLTEGNFLEISNSGISDNITVVSGTASSVLISKISQVTLNSVAASVTTTKAASNYIEGAVIVGTNETINNTSALFIDSVNSINTGATTVGTASSLYIQGSPTGNNITNSRSILVNSGISEFKGKVISSDTTSVSGNTLTGSLELSGDLTTTRGIFFNSVAGAVPSFTTRSSGTKLVLKPNISGSTVDSALGTVGDSLWYSTGDSHSFYLGTLNRANIDSTGITFNSGNPTGTNSLITSLTTESIAVGNGVSEVNVSDTVSISTDSTTRLTVAQTGELTISSVTDSTSSSSNSSIKTLGGISVAKAVSVGTELNLDFNQPYSIKGNVSGNLEISSKVTGVSSNIKYYTNDGDKTDNNVISIFSLGTRDSNVNSESLKLGFDTTDGFIIRPENTGTGTLQDLTLGNSGQLKLNSDTSITLSSTLASTNSSTGALVLAGGISISNTTNCSSDTVGGSFTTAGGMSVAKDLRVREDLYVTGAVSFGISDTTVTVSNSVNTGAEAVASNGIINKNGIYRDLSCVFRMSPVVSGTETSFEFALPDLVTNFTDLYSVTLVSNGFVEASLNSIENITGYSVVGTTRVKVKFTSGSTGVNTVQVIAKYKI